MAELLSIKYLNQTFFWSRNPYPSEGIIRNSASVEKNLDVICDLDIIHNGKQSSSNSSPTLTKNQTLCKSSSSSSSEHNKKILVRYGGILLATICSFLLSVELFLAKILQTYGFDPTNTSFYRYAPSPILCIIFIIYHECGSRGKAEEEAEKRKSIFEPIWPLSDPVKRRTFILLLVCSTFSPLTMIFRYLAVQHLTIGDASTISCSSPIFVSILAHFFLKEKTGIIPIFSAILTLLGVAVISRPPILTGEEQFNENTLIGTAYASASLLSFTLFILFTRRLSSVHFILLLFVLSIFGLVGSFTLTQIGLFPPVPVNINTSMSMNMNTSSTGIGNGIGIGINSNPGNHGNHITGLIFPHGAEEALLLLALAFSAVVSQIMLNVALQIEKAAIVSLVRTSDIVFGFLIQFIFLGVAPDLYSAIGGFVVLFGILIVTFRTFVADLPKDNSFRKYLSFLLY